MSMERIYKSAFCKAELSALLKAVDRGIRNARYEEIDGEEYVRINYDNGSNRRICVTADSLIAMARDVLGVVE